MELLARGDAVASTCTVPLPEQLSAAAGGALGKGALAAVLERSRLLCLQRYEKDLLRPDSYLRYYQRLEFPLTPAQLAVFAGARCAVLTGKWRRALRLGEAFLASFRLCKVLYCNLLYRQVLHAQFPMLF